MVHLEALDLWEAIEEDYEVTPLLENHKEKKTRKSKAKACLFSALSSTIFTRVMNLGSAKSIWEYLKKEYQGNGKTKNMQILNLIREFEIQKIKETETIREYSNKLLSIVNKVRLLGKDFSDERIVENILVSIPERYESKISSLEETKDLSTISLAELVNAMQAQEQRRSMREEGSMEGAFQTNNEAQEAFQAKGVSDKRIYKFKSDETCPHCKKTGHEERKCLWRPDIKCRKCGKLGHVERVCKTQQKDDANAMIEESEEKLFVATSSVAASFLSDSW